MSDMILIPGGKFVYGSDDSDAFAHSNEYPQKTIFLKDFYIDRHLVTNKQYCEFLNSSDLALGDVDRFIDIGINILRRKKYVCRPEVGDHPVVYVSWFGAHAYALWAGKLLPTEQQWEKAARGTGGDIYPWGNVLDPSFCNYLSEGTSVVGTHPKDVSPYGCYDISGNVREWTSDYSNDGNRRIIRGSSWGNHFILCRCAFRSECDIYCKYSDIGFRCACDGGKDE